MKPVLFLSACVLATAAGSMEGRAAPAQVCKKGGDVRTLEVLTPGVKGKACDLRYTYNSGATVKTPYHANADAGFCTEKEKALRAQLIQSGYTCEVEDVTDVAAVAPNQPNATQTAPAPVASAPVEESTAAASGATIAENSSVDARDNNEAAADIAPSPAAPAQSPDETASATTPAPQMRETVAEIPSDNAPASQGPVTLTNASLATETLRKPRKSAVGRLMGAEPSEPAEPPVGAAEIVNASATKESNALLAQADAQTGTKRVQKLRPAPDIIRGVIAAQAAAWNEGDLEAFMTGYWKSPDLRFVSGTDVTTGWTQTLKRYRARYGDSADLGTLSFKNLDVEMITDDVAIVVGKFVLEKDAAENSGMFSLVMKRFQGRWRIVHDHTSSDAQPTAETD